jgi:O-antigen/teichoic acid export membrane protein
MSRIFFRISGLVGANAASQMIQFGMFLFLARNNGPEDLGKVLIGLVIANFAFAAFDFGASTYFTREIAKGILSKNVFASIFYTRSMIFLTANAVVAIVSASTGNWLLATICAVAVSQYLFHGLQSVAKSDVKVSNLSVAVISDRLVCFLFIVVANELVILTPETMLLGWVAGQLVGTLIVSMLSLKGIRNVGLAGIRAAMNYNSHFHLGLFAFANVLVTLDQAVLGSISGPKQTGLLGAVAKWFAPLGVVSYSASLVVSNQSVRNFETPKEAIKNYSKYWLGLGAVAVLVSLSGLYLGNFVEILLGPEFLPAKDFIWILAISASLIFINQPLASLLQYFNREKFVSIVMWIAAPAYLICLACSLLAFSGQGAMIAVICQLFMQGFVLTSLIMGVYRSRAIK